MRINRIYGAARLICLAVSLTAGAVFAQGTNSGAPAPGLRGEEQSILHLLDYVGVDYGGAVEGGKVKSAEEFKEMVEFSERAASQIKALPDNAKRGALVADAEKLARKVADKAPAKDVAQAATALRWALIEAYRMQVAPRKTPDLVRGAFLYSAQCSSCHGAQGRGDGAAGAALRPAPANFHNESRMNQRSAFSLYNTISLGVTGTSMAAFANLPEDDRWALAFYVANLGTSEAHIKQGETLWKSATPADPMRIAFPDLGRLATLTADEVNERHGIEATRVQAYLRAHPDALAAAKPAPIAFARQRIAEALAAWEKGDRPEAQRLGVSAYLEGFELAESSLDNVDGELRLKIEHAMLDLRTALGAAGDASAMRDNVRRVDALLSQANDKLTGGGLSASAAFVSSLVILLREGLEAILLLSAIIAFVTRTGRRDALPWVHAGWIIAFFLGALTWVVATYFIGISGANREMTEGVTALIAAAMLLYVGYWLHGRSHAQAWSRFLKEQVDSALEKKTLWAMASVSFLAVYRELFEVVLFYEALWVQAGDDGHAAVGGGIGLAVALLALAGWGIFKYSVRLPLGPFFTVMSALLALMAVVFAGQGVAALQEAGIIGISRVSFVTISILGIHPSLQSLGAQLLTLALVGVSYWFSTGTRAQKT